MERRSKFITFIVALIPGAGQMYLGLLNKGIQLLALFVLINPLLDFIGLGFLGNMIQLVIWCYSFFDTFDIARRMDRGEQLKDTDYTINKYVDQIKNEDFPSKEVLNNKLGIVLGWGLVVVGILAIANRTFLNNELYGVIKSFVSMYFIPMVLIAAGVFMLIRNKK